MGMPTSDNDVTTLEQEIAKEATKEVALLCHARGYGVFTVEVKDGHVYGVDLHLTSRPRRKNN